MVFSLVTIFPYSSNSFDCLLIVAIFERRIKEIYTDYTSIDLLYLRQRRSSKPSDNSSKSPPPVSFKKSVYPIATQRAYK